MHQAGRLLSWKPIQSHVWKTTSFSQSTLFLWLLDPHSPGFFPPPNPTWLRGPFLPFLRSSETWSVPLLFSH